MQILQIDKSRCESVKEMGLILFSCCCAAEEATQCGCRMAELTCNFEKSAQSASSHSSATADILMALDVHSILAA
jgi:putative lipase involved disintegration of autophagic bodies